MHRSCDPPPLLPCCPPLAPACLCFGSGSQVPAALPPSFAPDWPACALLCRFPPPLPPQALLSQVRGLSPSTLTCGPPVRHTHTGARRSPALLCARLASLCVAVPLSPPAPSTGIAFSGYRAQPQHVNVRTTCKTHTHTHTCAHTHTHLRWRVALACLAPAPSPGGCALLFPGGAVPHAVEGCV